ncbi:type II secretion system F family protein [Aliivibrio fischeri]|uniref:type II secretion system F family protein n=1 Tax=Aliivibrio fischeri TaxID=668 RepID=UPI0007C53BD1|nr:type II secretion system F family protein [Aliivibrio fischeri]MBP3139414.1 type II secretion system F family protein [Aliivibrio fischeri]MBP3155005.1 type II secretion system F family protein [Aliivibrio fischeri]MCE7573176.1 type II secretion system F family protein [Aliivibrio fischeri]
MNSQTILFIELVSVFIGISLFLWLLVQILLQRKLLGKYLAKHKEFNKDDNVFDKVERFLPSVTSNDADSIERKFYSAGLYESKYAHLYMPVKYLTAAIGSGIIYLLLGKDSSMTTQVALMCIWLVVCISIPDAILSSRKKALEEKLSGQLPYLLDLLAMCVHTGMTIESSLSYLAKEMQGFDKDLAHMIARTNDRANIVGLEPALDELYVRVPTNEMRSFVMTLKQSLHYGSSIYEILNTLAADIRSVRLLSLEEKVGKLAAKMSVPLILFIMIPVVILIAAPGVMRMMTGVY